MDSSDNVTIRTAYGAGRWFPGDSATLQEMVKDFVQNAKPDKSDGRIVGAIAPHAGYRYSGKVAGYAFRAIADSLEAGVHPETAVILGFTHRSRFPGVALMDGDMIETPMGQTALDNESGKLLADGSRRIFYDYRPHMGEHSAENLVPFVQQALPGVKMVIALMGDHEPKTVKELVSALSTLAKKKKVLLLASSDMLHDPDYHKVTRTDNQTLRLVSALDYQSLKKGWRPTKQLFCGIGPVLAVMRFAELQGIQNGTVLHYRNSGDDHPESRGQWVVGYAAVVFSVPNE